MASNDPNVSELYPEGVRRIRRNEGGEDEERDDQQHSHLKKAARKTGSRQRGSGNSKKLVAARNKTVDMVTANQDCDAKPVEKKMGSRQQGACHT
eukprot:4971204-Ditylum_brightwellii.AAC.1